MKTDVQARPVFIWTDEHIEGHFVLCSLSLCMLRYLQYLMAATAGDRCSQQKRYMRAIHEPLVVGFDSHIYRHPHHIPQIYLDIAEMLRLPRLMKNMTLTKFRSATKLDLLKNKVAF